MTRQELRKLIAVSIVGVAPLELHTTDDLRLVDYIAVIIVLIARSVTETIGDDLCIARDLVVVVDVIDPGRVITVGQAPVFVVDILGRLHAARVIDLGEIVIVVVARSVT